METDNDRRTYFGRSSAFFASDFRERCANLTTARLRYILTKESGLFAFIDPTVMSTFVCRTTEDFSSKPIRCGRVLPKILPLILLLGVFSLATLAKVVTYTPYGGESVQYSSNAGRRMVSSSRRLAGKQVASVQSVKRPFSRSHGHRFYPPTHSRILVSAHRPGVIPLRSPPNVLQFS